MEWLGGGTARRQFEAFVAGAMDPLFRTGYLMTWDASETEDLLQETFLRVARRWARVRAMEYPIAYARRILVNLALDGTQRRQRLHGELVGGELELGRHADEAAVRVLRGIDDLAEFQWALSTLTPRQRAVLVLRYWDDLSEPEVAEILGCPLGTVKSSASRGVHHLRQVLGGSEPSADKRGPGDDKAVGESEEGRQPC